MVVKFDVSVDAWIRDIQVEGDSKEDCKDKLLRMSLQDLIDSGYVKDFDLSNVDEEVERFGADVKVTNIKYRVDDEGSAEALALPETMDITVADVDEDSIEDAIIDNIFEATDAEVDDFDYKIIRKF